MKNYSLKWWYEFGRVSKQRSYISKSHARTIRADLAFKFGYWVAQALPNKTKGNKMTTLAKQISDDFEEMMDEFDSAAEANDHFFILVQLKSTTYECDGLTTTYGFRDNSTISFKNFEYWVGL